jgi:hypothetical protein
MTFAAYIFTLGAAAGAAFLLVVGFGLGAHACRLRRQGFSVIREDDHD